MPVSRGIHRCVVAAAGVLVSVGLTRAATPSTAPTASQPPDKPLPRMIEIAWSKGPSLPQGFQDSDGGIISNTLVTVGGFCQGQPGPAGKEKRYPRGFLRKTWGLDLKVPAASWQELPDLPGPARQELSGIVVDDALYCWGGFSYSTPFCYSDGYQLVRRDNAWRWEELPALPWAVGGAGICAVDGIIYAMGGSDYDEQQFYTAGDRKGDVKRLGSRLLAFDTRKPTDGWKELPACPGTPRWVHAMAAVQGKLYVLGGATGNDNPAKAYCTVVDNWRYDPKRAAWERLADLPVASGNFPGGRIVFGDRYILLVGGAQYENVLTAEGTLAKPYGRPIKHYPDKPYFSDVFVYDTTSGTFGTATPLPLNNNLPMAVVEGDRLHLIGGETAGCTVEGESFGHHPDLYLVGHLRVADDGARRPR